MTRTVLFAQAATSQPADTGSQPQAFRPVSGGTATQSGEVLLVEAYAVIWAILFVLLLFSWRRQKQIDRRIDLLEAAIEKARGEAKGAS